MSCLFGFIGSGNMGGALARAACMTLNPKEAMAMQWVELDALAKDLQQNPQKYSAWFLTAAPMVLAELKKG